MLSERKVNGALRSLPNPHTLVDFSSNDYLGFAKSKEIFKMAGDMIAQSAKHWNGATGSRLLSGNSVLYNELEDLLANFHQAEAALIFNSGYDANVGFFASVPQRGDLILYDEYIHASIRDGIKMGNAKSYKFKHNDLEDLYRHIDRSQDKNGDGEVYIVTESVFSMDGDSPDLKELTGFCEENGHHLIVDEAHAVGIFGKNGEGLLQELGMEDRVFARIVTFGKAMGCHGAALLGSKDLREYLINFARSFIYTTGLPPHSLATIMAAYRELQRPKGRERVRQLNGNTEYFNLLLETLPQKTTDFSGESHFIPSVSPIHCCIVPGNERVKSISKKIQNKGFDVKPILSPTVPKGEERLRLCIHSDNTQEEIEKILKLLRKLI